MAQVHADLAWLLGEDELLPMDPTPKRRRRTRAAGKSARSPRVTKPSEPSARDPLG